MRFAHVALAALAATGAVATPVSNAVSIKYAPLEVSIKNGTVKGVELPTFDQHFFGGIPYSDPPKRFERSVARTTEFDGGVYHASNYSNTCYGIGNAGLSSFNQSEDCLSINIVRPSHASNDKLPVVLWLHGGGNYQGASSVPLSNGSWIVEQSVEMGKPIIFTSINYRLLVLGFPSGDEPYAAGVENLGLHDQRLAMEWIQENIEAFGGDKDKVTVMGESAGGTDILQHLVAYGGKKQNLFRAAIVESGSFYQVNCTWNATEQAQANWQSLLDYTNCADLACLKLLDTETMVNASVTFWDTFLPSVDGDILPEHPVQLYDEKKFVDVALLMGVNADEGTILSVTGCDNDTALTDGLVSLNQSSYVVFEDDFAKILEAYPDIPGQGIPLNTGDGLLASGTMDKRSNAMFNDAIEHSPKRWISGLLADAGNPVYTYHFQQVPYGNTIQIGATHATELAYVFSNPGSLGPRETDAQLAKFMTRSWVSYIHDLDPSHTGLKGVPTWPKHVTKKPKNMVFKATSPSHIEHDTYRAEGIQLWTEQRIKGCKNLAPKWKLA